MGNKDTGFIAEQASWIAPYNSAHCPRGELELLQFHSSSSVSTSCFPSPRCCPGKLRDFLDTLLQALEQTANSSVFGGVGAFEVGQPWICCLAALTISLKKQEVGVIKPALEFAVGKVSLGFAHMACFPPMVIITCATVQPVAKSKKCAVWGV